MFLKRVRTGARFYSFAPHRYFSARLPKQAEPVEITVRRDLVSLTLRLSGEAPMNFFVSPSFTFNTLKETIQAQYQNEQIEYDFSSVKKLGVDEDFNVYEFMNMKNKGEIGITIGNDSFTLSNTLASPLSQLVLPFVEGSMKDPNCVTHWYGKFLENKLQPTHAGTLSYFLRSLSGELEKFKGKMSEKELDAIISKAIVFGREPTIKKLEECYHELNSVNSMINELEKDKELIEKNAERRINLYLGLIFLASVIQFMSFYYMIFHVEWLGWDIIEPITYTVQCLTVALGWRFFFKYRMGRDLDAIRKINRDRMIGSNKLMKSRYQIVMRQLAHKKAERELLIMKRDLYLNRRNYYQFFFNPTQNFDVRETA